MRSGSGSYAFADALRNIKKNSVMSTASIVILVACLVMTATTILVIFNINIFMGQLESQNEIVAFIDDSILDDDITVLGEKISAMQDVAEVTYVTKEQAFEEYKSQLGEEAEIFESLRNDNPLRNSYHIKLAHLESYDLIVTQLSEMPEIAKIRESKSVVDKIITIRSGISILAVWVVAILVFLSLFIISSTVRLAMFTRRLEISIMKYVGATDNFIRLPFLIEGLLLGMLSGIIAFALEWLIYGEVVVNILADIALFTPFMFGEYWIAILGILLVCGGIIGAIGSVLPMRKYLNV